MSEPMSRIRALRKKAACELVLALRSAFEQCNATRDTKLQRLIVAGFEMQSGDVLVGAPVAPVEGMSIVHIERRADRPAIEHTDDEQKIIRHDLLQSLE